VIYLWPPKNALLSVDAASLFHLHGSLANLFNWLLITKQPNSPKEIARMLYHPLISHMFLSFSTHLHELFHMSNEMSPELRSVEAMSVLEQGMDDTS
jgi:hypothetical protein